MSDCATVRELAPELALGLVTGQERAAAMAHLQSCPGCRAELDRLAGVGDALRALVPPAEPPAGFEQRVLDRLERAREPRPRRGRLLLVAAALVGVAVFGAGWAAGSSTAPRVVAAAVAEPLTSGDHRVGDVVVDRDRPDLLSVWLESPSAGRLTCDLLRRDGTVAASVTYDATGGAEWWGVPRPDGEVATMRIADEAGGFVASGSVPSPP
ncbi:zf-HC2 domain-containing protein [Pseudonocardia xishanensis]|uniref:Putative zinc-finger domain-containing protein n=1 Tax=Pseudonocardia xishanensis TaxID=630995 RepID=A0ABP8RVP0_9PSEU